MAGNVSSVEVLQSILSMSRCESLVLYGIMYGNKAMEVQRRNYFVVGSDNSEILGSWRLLGSWWNITEQSSKGQKFVAELDGDASPISFTPRFCHPRHQQA